MTYPWPTLMLMGIDVISCDRLSAQLSVGLGFGIVVKSLGRKRLHFGMLMYPDDLPLVCWSLWVLLSICPFVQPFGLWVCWEGYRHYWGMAAAIVGGYLLLSLAAHSSKKVWIESNHIWKLLCQGSHRLWKTWKNKIFWKSHGKSWNLEKSSKVMEKSWNFENCIPIIKTSTLIFLLHLQCPVFIVTHLIMNYKGSFWPFLWFTLIDVWLQYFINI